MHMLAAIPAMLGIGGTAAATGTAAAISATLPMAGGTLGAGFAGAGAAAGAAAGGISLSTILQGGATVLGLVSSIAAGKADQAQAEMMAADAEAEKPLETLKGIDRRRSLKLATAEAVGEIDAAYAASGVDLSFGTAAEARKDAFREADLGMTSDSMTTMTRLSRLSERAANYRQMGKRALRAGIIGGLGNALGNAASIAGRY